MARGSGVAVDEAGDEAGDAGTGGEIAGLAREFTAALAREQELAQRRETVIARLHAELEDLRRGEVERALDLVRHPLIRLHDQLLRQAASLEAPLTVEESAALLRAFADEAADALAGTGVERYTARVGEPYDPARHRPVGREAARTPEDDRTVAGVVSAGFAAGDRVVRKAEVRVARWDPGAAAHRS
ncbi:nucleotide exchange factor GrpE [Kitasatospora sp. NPDC058115]|uniref:nucleotide exchange factor GrpE n=1 Tax=Kitasatospora sp. NPDC058115 TaxID=3346347 RepID=UPI0036DE6E0B